MSLPDFFAACLFVGVLLSVLSFFGGSHHLHLHVHGHHGGGAKFGSAFNMGTIAAFIMWFGGAGSILLRFKGLALLMVLAGAVAFGLAGAALIYWFLTRVLAPGDKPLDPADYRIVGALGKVSGRVTPRGTGEMIFEQQGRRVGIPVRSENEGPIAVGTEVVVTRYEDGIAYVRTWEEFSA